MDKFSIFTLGRIPIQLSRETVDKYIPDCFKKLYPNTREIIDCTEIRMQQPSSLVLNFQLYSHYKRTHTLELLLMVLSHLFLPYILVVLYISGILGLLEPGDDVMADKGFTLTKMLEDRGITLNTPPFLRVKGSLPRKR